MKVIGSIDMVNKDTTNVHNEEHRIRQFKELFRFPIISIGIFYNPTPLQLTNWRINQEQP